MTNIGISIVAKIAKRGMRTTAEKLASGRGKTFHYFFCKFSEKEKLYEFHMYILNMYNFNRLPSRKNHPRNT